MKTLYLIMLYHFIENKQTSKKETIQLEIDIIICVYVITPSVWASTDIDWMAY